MAHAAVYSLKLAMMELADMSAFQKYYSDDSDIVWPDADLDSFLEAIELLPSYNLVDAASETRVKDAAQQLQDLTESHVSHLLLRLSDHQSESYSLDDYIGFTFSFSQQLSQVKQELSSFLTALNSTEQQQLNKFSSDYSSPGKQQDLVGLDEQIKVLKEWIQHPYSSLKVTTIAGMTGIGKTTLVKHVYSDPNVVDGFETRLFVHVGPRYNKLEEIMLLVLNQLGVVFPTSDELLHKNKDYLRNQLWEALSGQKYLIVLDDVWTGAHVWSSIEFKGFPRNEKRSRIIITSQIQTIDSFSLRYKMITPLPLLNDDDSWKLLHQTAFSSGYKCSSELEKIGKKIAKNCQGLPAAIIQVGENLRGKLVQEWKTLSENEDPLVITRNDDTPLSKELYFSYTMMPQYLKVFFLYMGVFPKEYVISRSMLIKLWVSEGFFNLLSEDHPEDYLDRLICQNIVLIQKKASISNETTKNCSLHFTFRSLCVNEAKSEKFFHVMKKYIDCMPEKMRGQHRLCIHNNVVLAFREVHEWMESVPNIRSLLCFGPKQQYPIMLPLCFRLLKILDALGVRFYEFPHQVFSLIQLSYLSITCGGELPNSISRLLNLEVLIFSRHHNIKLSKNGPAYLPLGIWKLRKLRQLYCMGFDLPAPPPLDDSNPVLENLVTLSGVSVYSCTMKVLSRIPMLKRVAVKIESAHDSVETFSFFSRFTSLYEEFESFKCIVVNPNLMPHIVHCIPNFPMYIKKITLSGCGFPWKKIEVLSGLQDLKVLKLRWYAFCGPIWKISDAQFPRLKFLLLEDLDIEQWEFEGQDMQMMQKVIFRHCYKLKSFPDNLQYTDLVEVDDCNLSFMKKMRALRFAGGEAKISSSITPR
ncbi:PREDICTED: putative late blight resistance protein homolog R1A-10 [Erythranthe guttata]|uniref:putative late blight resistance protein homolog R1A-10 n=1 Tax=Erythranthe guttata TaxID=4155 RepID=UPI00064DEB84|nr:PREDICTED: putative late blight resistance protein homolog R1A-10 [Erythranthe guttata]|eukprot:XP_012855818.1 PREDICTED: putative late blight resistance protein homolog R1A-10 [Erythranthe guttata]